MACYRAVRPYPHERDGSGTAGFRTVECKVLKNSRGAPGTKGSKMTINNHYGYDPTTLVFSTGRGWPPPVCLTIGWLDDILRRLTRIR
jgi:hypothetical protein